MRCPECQHNDTRVVDSRSLGGHIRRRRECQSCGHRFTTHERLERPTLWVLKKGGGREPFSRGKVLHGITLACRKRPVSSEGIEDAADRVTAALEKRRSHEVGAAEVGEAVLRVLRDLDDVAYVRFASVYQAFETVEHFVEIIRPLQEQR